MAEEARYAETMEERRQKRLISNRESARRSRSRKKKYMKDLMMETAWLNYRSKELRQRAKLMRQSLVAARIHNNMLRTQKDEIIKKIEAVQCMIIYLKTIADSRNIKYPNNPIQVEQTLNVEQTYNVDQTLNDNLWMDDFDWQMQNPLPDVYPQTMPMPLDQPSMLQMPPPPANVYSQNMPMLPDQPSLLPPLPPQSAPTTCTSSGDAFNF